MARGPRKGLLEEAWRLRMRDFLARYNGPARGGRVWLDARRPDGSGEALTVTLDVLDDNAVRVAYDRDGEPRSYRIALAAVPQRFGGVRWLWRCPLVGESGRGCGRRARALYLPPRARFFGCMRCHGLTYASVQRPVASRLRRLLAALDGCNAEMASGDSVRRALALHGARESVSAFLASLSARGHRPPSE
jgi:hypothetical protein